MISVRYVILGILAISPVFASQLTVRKVSYEDAVTLLADRALMQPRVEVVRRGGHTVKGKLVSATRDGFYFEGRPNLPLCDCQSVKVLGVMARPRRIAKGIAFGVIGGLYAAGVVLFESDVQSPTLALSTVVGLPTIGGWAGARLAERGYDVLYVLQVKELDALCGSRRDGVGATPPGEETISPPLPPLQLSQP